jgi:hypothetical protein
LARCPANSGAGRLVALSSGAAGSFRVPRDFTMDKFIQQLINGISIGAIGNGVIQ